MTHRDTFLQMMTYFAEGDVEACGMLLTTGSFIAVSCSTSFGAAAAIKSSNIKTYTVSYIHSCQLE